MNEAVFHDTGIVCLGAFGGWYVWCPCGIRRHGLTRDEAISLVADHLREVGESNRVNEFLAYWRTIDGADAKQAKAT